MENRHTRICFEATAAIVVVIAAVVGIVYFDIWKIDIQDSTIVVIYSMLYGKM